LDGPTLEPRKGNVDWEYTALDPVQKGNYKKSWSYYIFLKLISKLNFKNKKIYYFNIFSNKKYFKK
jgi:hypothetical protein